ncbi:MAG: thioredoxin domain-containing protein [Thiomicrospira sp.]|uniref:thioredoxin domain-containing protein n=1 Tax=Thiomicrospira sp. TaxID=935 RepID=UPI0019F64E22|nr:DUF255 domain-containing protein [Thiomicrospira sp.]MBE0493046.1 thioredoxin domain-containing protein [Thiomicrospira sp.]
MTNLKATLNHLARRPSWLSGWGFVLIFMLPLPIQASALTNHPSAYLAMHADDPVNWQLWQQDTLNQAKQQNKLILISSGYFACHWCHVMQQENYQDPQVAALLNQHFISVKIDRELSPDLDDHLLAFARRATGQAGWPLHVILTPDGYPFTSFIYLPRDDLINRLNRVQQLWQTEAGTVKRLSQADQTSALEPISFEQLKPELIRQLPDQVDNFSGGLNATQKFPNSPLLKALLMQKDLESGLLDWLEITLEAMQTEHLYDHVHHGFFRYTVDPTWQEPHFEKMLYDNAQLSEIYFLAYQRFQRSDFLETAENTLNYIQTELLSPLTGLAQSSQSAIDEDGLDGGRYLWTRQQLEQTLTPELYQIVQQAWSLNQAPPLLNYGWLPKPLDNHQAWLDIQSNLAIRPGLTDDKQLIGWNGLLLSAYAQAYTTTKSPHYALLGHALAQRLIQLLLLEEAPRAINDQGQFSDTAGLEDFAYSLAGLIDWQTATKLDLSQPIKQLSHKTNQLFWRSAGWATNQANLLPTQQVQLDYADSATPSVSGLLRCSFPSDNQTPLSIQTQPGLPLWRYASYLTHEGC